MGIESRIEMFCRRCHDSENCDIWYTRMLYHYRNFYRLRMFRVTLLLLIIKEIVVASLDYLPASLWFDGWWIRRWAGQGVS